MNLSLIKFGLTNFRAPYFETLKSRGVMGATVLLLVAFGVLVMPANVHAQTGYIYVHQKNLDEASSPNFLFSVTGGAPISSFTLNDGPEALYNLASMGADAGGGLFAVAGNTVGALGGIYYRATESSQWVNMNTSSVYKIDGAGAGNYISVVYESGTYKIFYKNSVTPVNITGTLSGEAFYGVSDNWQGIRYVLTSDGRIHRRSMTGSWSVTGITNVKTMDAVPNTNKLVYTRTGSNIIYRADNDATNEENLGEPDPSNTYDVYSVAVSGDGTIWAEKGRNIYRYTSGGWVVESSALNLGYLTGGPQKMLWGALDGVDNPGGLPARIFARATTEEYIDDERVRTGTAGNVIVIPVTAGAYDITQNPVAGWHTTDIRLYETVSPSSVSIAGGSASIIVSENEIVHVEFENQLTQSTAITTNCLEEYTYTEDFGEYDSAVPFGPVLTGLTSYHKADVPYGYGYYAVLRNANQVGPYAHDMKDHTTGNGAGRMLVVDAGYEKGIFYRRRFTNLVSGAKYNFSAWVANINAQGAAAVDVPNVSFELYNAITGAFITSINTGDITDSNIWKQQSFVFTAQQSDLELVLRNNTTGTRGNDLAIDDISFGVSIPKPVATVANEECNTLGTVTVTAPISDNYEYSIDGTNFQSSTVFFGLVAGTYTITVKYAESEFLCNSALYDVKVIDNCNLPVTLFNFDARSEGNVAQLGWTTSSEANADRFEVERSADAKKWFRIGSLQAAGESSILKSYKFNDETPLTATNYYRLKMIDKDATFAYSTIKSVEFSNQGKSDYVYPNPASEVVKLRSKDLSRISYVEILDLKGKVIYQSALVSPEGICVKNIPNGAYILKVTQNDGSHNTHKVLINK